MARRRPASRSRSRRIWDASRVPGASISARLHPILWELGLVDLLAFLRSLRVDDAARYLRSVFSNTRLVFCAKALSSLARVVAVHTTRTRALACAAGLAFLGLLAYIHVVTGAGAFLFICACLAAIYYCGFSSGAGGMSAYSVFNEGFRQMAGQLDAEALAEQYVRGAAGFGAAAAVPPPGAGDGEGEGEGEGAGARRRRGR